METALSRTATGSAEDRYGDLIDPQTPDLAPLAATPDAALRGYLDASQAPATRRAYRRDWRSFTAWCAAAQLPALPADPATVARYLVDQVERGRAVATLTRRLSAISVAHQAAGHDSPTAALIVRKTLSGIKRQHGTAQRQAAPLLPDDLRQLLGHLDDTPAGRRDRALLLLGFAGAFRRAELVSLDVSDLQVRPGGLLVTLRRSKTDQEGAGTQKAIPRGRHADTCPVRAVQAWLAASQLADGPLFRPIDRHGTISQARLADYHVTRLIKRLCALAGLDPAIYSGHSLRAGLATAAAAAGVDERHIMRQTGHTNTRTLRKYIRDGELWRDNAAGAVDL